MNGEISAAFKSRLIQACHDYCVDNGFAPMVGVVDRGRSQFPSGFAKDGFISFDLSGTAVRSLEFDDEWITFDARFNGVATSVCLHVDEVAWAGSPVGDCMLGFATGVMPADADLDRSMALVSDDDAAVKSASDSLKLI